MAWIKMQHDVGEKPEVVSIACRLCMDRFAVIGRLHKVWSWFDQHTGDGSASGITPAFLDQLVLHEGFAASMTAVGWLVPRHGSLVVPNFDRHNSKSAKDRALAAVRQSRSRNASCATKTERFLSYSDSFLLFWDSFPKGRRKSKRKAWEAWEAARALVAEETLISAAKEYANSDEGRGEYVKMPSTWLNQECWDDDREAWKSKCNGHATRRVPSPMELLG